MTVRRLLTLVACLTMLAGCTKTGGKERPSGKPGEQPAASAPATPDAPK